jgi:hypothetical protein
MERVVQTYRFGSSEVDVVESDVVESVDDDGSWLHLIVAGQTFDEVLPHAPTVAELRRLLRHSASG